MSSSRRCRWARPWAALLLALAALPARAVLGEAAASVQDDQIRLGATRRQATAAATTATGAGAGTAVHTLQWADGSSVREYLLADGRVYAVAWSMRTKPRLDQLLGRHFAAYTQAARDALWQRPGVHHNQVLVRGDLVVESTAQGNAHVGRAYLQSLLPAGGRTDALR